MSLLVGKFVNYFIDFLRVHQVSVIKVHSTGWVKSEQLIVQIKDVRPRLAHSLINRLSKQLQKVFHVLLAHNMRLAILLLDRRHHILVQDGINLGDCLFHLALLWLEAGLLINGEKPGFRALGDLREVLRDKLVLVNDLALLLGLTGQGAFVQRDGLFGR